MKTPQTDNKRKKNARPENNSLMTPWNYDADMSFEKSEPVGF